MRFVRRRRYLSGYTTGAAAAEPDRHANLTLSADGEPIPDHGTASRRGLAWERRAELGPGTAMARTIFQVVFAPGTAFREMKQAGGWGEPLGFALLVGSVAIWAAQLWDMLTRSLLVGLTGTTPEEVAAANLQEILFALLAPVLVLAVTFFVAAVVHVLLLMLGGAPHPYETTFRVICYTWSAGIFNLVPVCGVLIAAIWRIVVQIIGIREAQEVPTGRAAAAVLIPIVVACFCLFAVVLVAIGVAGLATAAAP